LALDYVRRYPAHISHAVVIGGPLQFTDAARAAARRYFEAHADDERKAEAARAVAEIPPEELATPSSSDWWHRRYLANRALFWRDPTYDAAYLFGGSHINIEAFRHTSRLMQGHDLTLTLPAVACPVFVAQGRYDFSVPPPVWEEARRRLPRGTYRVFEQSGHWPMIEEHAAFDAALIDWLAATSP